MGNNQDLIHCCYYEKGIGKVKALLEKGANINFSDFFGNRPIIIASKYKKEKLLLFLLEKGADINAVDRKGSTPLMFLAYNKRCDLLEKAINAGALMDMQDNEGRTIVDYALNIKNNHNVLNLLWKNREKLLERDVTRLNKLKFKVLFKEEIPQHQFPFNI